MVGGTAYIARAAHNRAGTAEGRTRSLQTGDITVIQWFCISTLGNSKQTLLTKVSSGQLLSPCQGGFEKWHTTICSLLSGWCFVL
jgi:hypothetical protein